MPLHCFLIGLVLSIDGFGSYKSAQILIIDGEEVKHEIMVKYYQSNENKFFQHAIIKIPMKKMRLSSTYIVRMVLYLSDARNRV